MSADADTEECERVVREQDPDRAVSILFAPPDKRPHLLALYAFNVETARVREQISQPLPGEIRLQWWRDVIAGARTEGLDGGTREGVGHPVANALVAAINACDLPIAAFDRLLDARIFDLYDDPMQSRSAFEAYAGETASALIMLAAMILDRGHAPQAADAAGHAGVAQAAVGVLRLLPIHRRRGQVFIPADILAAAGCSVDALLSGEEAPTRRAVQVMIAFGREHLQAYDLARRQVPTALRAAFLPVAMTEVYLKRIETLGLAGAGPEPRSAPLRRLWTYWRSMRS